MIDSCQSRSLLYMYLLYHKFIYYLLLLSVVIFALHITIKYIRSEPMQLLHIERDLYVYHFCGNILWLHWLHTNYYIIYYYYIL